MTRALICLAVLALLLGAGLYLTRPAPFVDNCSCSDCDCIGPLEPENRP